LIDVAIGYMILQVTLLYSTSWSCIGYALANMGEVCT